ncbi:MAG: Xaa-Pro dipeptidase [Acidobacteriota bacterium]
MELTDLYQQHVKTLQANYAVALNQVKAQGLALDGVLLHSGSDIYYFADDQHIPFHPVPHFAHWLPLEGPNHFLLIQPDQPPRLIRNVPRDFWYETPVPTSNHWQACFDLVEVDSLEQARQQLPALTHIAYLGNDAALAREWGIKEELIQPRTLMSRLDYNRSIKTAYEIACLRLASARAARGHKAAQAAFQAGLSEREIHRDYLNAIEGGEADTPYGNIIALDEKAAILHYQQKRGPQAVAGRLLLIDAGARAYGYCSDITRTYLRNGDDPVFRALLDRMETLQRALVDQVRIGLSYVEIHRATHRGVADILSELEIIHLGAEEIFTRRFTHPFFPHGVGHFLGIQVHDVAGHISDPAGTPAPPPPEYPFLRNTRTIEAGQVFTIEPGFYFIPMLLEPYRQGEESKHFNWPLIDRLSRFGGIRIEDNIHVTQSGPENLTRAVL